MKWSLGNGKKSFFFFFLYQSVYVRKVDEMMGINAWSMMDEMISTTDKNTPGYKHLIQALHAQSRGGSIDALLEP